LVLRERGQSRLEKKVVGFEREMTEKTREERMKK
jgi:hypothetical protein